MQKRSKRIVMGALLAALICVATMVIKWPLHPGYLNLGDCVVLIAGWMLSPMYGFLAAGIGSGLADIFSGCPQYALATFLIKGLMALFAHVLYKVFHKSLKDFLSRIVSGFAAELVMIGGYYLFEGILYGFGPSLVNIPFNAIQGTVGLVIGVVLIKVLKKSRITFE